MEVTRRGFVKFEINQGVNIEFDKTGCIMEKDGRFNHIQWAPNNNCEQTEAPDFRSVRIRGVSLRVSVLGCLFRVLRASVVNLPSAAEVLRPGESAP